MDDQVVENHAEKGKEKETGVDSGTVDDIFGKFSKRDIISLLDKTNFAAFSALCIEDVTGDEQSLDIGDPFLDPIHHVHLNPFNPLDVARNFFNLSKHLNKQEVSRDISRMVLIALVRGNLRRDQLSRTAHAGAEIMRKLVNRYKIVMRANASDRRSLRNDSITFGRILSVFPLQASSLIYNKPSLVKDNIPNEFGSEFCPAVLKHSGAASLIPQGNVGAAYLTAHVAFMIDFGSVINPGYVYKSDKAKYEEQLRFAQIANNRTYISEVDRVAFFKAAKLDTIESYKEVVKAANTLFRKLGMEELDAEPPTKAGKVFVATSDQIDEEAQQKCARMRLTYRFLEKEKAPDTSDDFSEPEPGCSS